MRTMRKVEVEWRDSSSYQGWASKEHYLAKAAGPSVCTTVGYLMIKNENEIFLVMNHSENDNVDLGMTIPRECVLKIRYLKGGL